MSALGHKRTSESDQIMSALPPKADIVRPQWIVRFVPKADVSRCSKERLFDHLVGKRKERRRYFETKRLGSLEVKYEFEPGRLLNREVGRPFHS